MQQSARVLIIIYDRYEWCRKHASENEMKTEIIPERRGKQAVTLKWNTVMAMDVLDSQVA